MRDYGNGSVYRRGDGKWVAAIVVDGKRRVKYAKTEREARGLIKTLWQEAALDEAAREAEEAQQARETAPTVAEFAEQWLESATVKPATKQSYRWMLDAYILPVIGTKHLDELKTQDVAAVVTAILKGGKSSRTAEHSYMITRRLLQVATDWELIPINPAAKVKRPKPEHAERQMWDVRQAESFIAYCLKFEGVWDDMFLFALLTGLRRGELLGLQWRDFDTERSLLHVKRNLVELKGRFLVQTPKTKAGTRSLVLTQQAIAALQHRYRVLGEPAQDTFVFRRPVGFAQSRSTDADAKRIPSIQSLADELTTACKRAGVPRLTLHSLRHMHISLLAHAGVPVKAVQQRVGHANPSITLNIYTHALGDADRRAADALDTLLGNKPNQAELDAELMRLRKGARRRRLYRRSVEEPEQE